MGHAVRRSTLATLALAGGLSIGLAGPAAADGDADTFRRLAFDDLPLYCLFSETAALRDEYADRGVRFRGPGPADGGGVLSTCAFFLVTGISPPTFLGFNQTAEFADGGVPRDPQTILFEPPVQFAQLDAGAFIEVGYPATLTAFDDQGAVVDTSTIALDEVAAPLLVMAPIIARVELSAPGARYIADDLLYGESAGDDLVLEPDSLAVALAPGAAASRTVTISNTSNHDLELFVRELSAGGETAAGPVEVVVGEAAPQQNLIPEIPSRLMQRHQEVPHPTAPRILVFTEVEPLATTPDSDLDQALRSLDLPYTAVYGGNVASMFLPALAGATWDLVIFDHQVAFLYEPDLAVYDALLSHVDGGGRLIMASWQIGDRPDHPLWPTLGFHWLASYTTPQPVYWTGAEPRFFAVPDDVPRFTELAEFYNIDGHRIEVLPGTTILASLEDSERAGPDAAAMVLANDDRTLFRAFMDGNNICDCDADGRLDTVELWRDLVIQMLGEDMPWLATAAEGVVPAGGQLALEVRLDATDLAPGTAGATLLLRSNEAVFSTYTLDVRLEVSGGELFADGFESGDTAAWSGTGGR